MTCSHKLNSVSGSHWSSAQSDWKGRGLGTWKDVDKSFIIQTSEGIQKCVCTFSSVCPFQAWLWRFGCQLPPKHFTKLHTPTFYSNCTFPSPSSHLENCHVWPSKCWSDLSTAHGTYQCLEFFSTLSHLYCTSAAFCFLLLLWSFYIDHWSIFKRDVLVDILRVVCTGTDKARYDGTCDGAWVQYGGFVEPTTWVRVQAPRLFFPLSNERGPWEVCTSVCLIVFLRFFVVSSELRFTWFYHLDLQQQVQWLLPWSLVEKS